VSPSPRRARSDAKRGQAEGVLFVGRAREHQAGASRESQGRLADGVDVSWVQRDGELDDTGDIYLVVLGEWSPAPRLSQARQDVL
jgi:hypothetical protein